MIQYSKNWHIIFILITISSVVYSQEAQWRGPQRNGIYPDTSLLKQWPLEGPELLVIIEGIGKGWSSAVISSDIIYVTGKKEKLDVLSAFDLEGNPLWQTAYGFSWKSSYPDARNTPTVEGDKVYITSGIGEVVCLNSLSGEIIWKKNPHKEFKGVPSYWGMAESLVLTDNAVICTIGGEDASVVAFNKQDGELVWTSPSINDARAYASPLIIERNGFKIVLVLLERNLLGINALNGEILWTQSLIPESAEMLNLLNHANTPLYKNGEIFITRGYDIKAVMFSLSEDGMSVKLKWKNDVLDTHFGGVVEVDGFIYGSNWIHNSNGNWVCLDWNTGSVKYEQKWNNKGAIIFANGLLYCMEEKRGKVALVYPDPSGFNIISTFRVEKGAGPYWAHPTIYNKSLLIRHGDVLMIYDLSID